MENKKQRKRNITLLIVLQGLVVLVKVSVIQESGDSDGSSTQPKGYVVALTADVA